MTPRTSSNPVIAGVLENLRQSRGLLLDPNPQNIDRCRISISQCVQKVVGVMEGDRSAWNRNELKESLLEMRGQLSAMARLLDSAAGLQRNLLRVAAEENRPAPVDVDAAAIQTVRHVHVLG